MNMSAPQDLQSVPDNALLVLFANGSAQAAQILTQRLMPKVFAQAFHKLQNRADAEDVTQEAFLRLWRVAKDWQQDQAQVSTWLYRVVENLCIDRLRRKKPMADISDMPNEPADPAPSQINAMQDRARVHALYSAIAELPERQSQAIRLRHLDERSNIEIAEIMDLSVDAVESLLSRGKRKLMALMHDQQSALGYRDETL